MLRKAILAYNPAYATDEKGAQEFLASLASVEPERVFEWAQLVEFYPEYPAADLLGELLEFELYGAASLSALLKSTTAEWRASLDDEGKRANPLGSFPRDASELFFVQCVKKHKLCLDDVNSLCEALPPSAHRTEAVDVAVGILDAHPDFDLLLLRGLTFSPVPLDYALLTPEDIVPCMLRLRARACCLCKDNVPCSTCTVLPQQGAMGACTAAWHVCRFCARSLNGAGAPVTAVPLANALIEVDGLELDCSAEEVTVSWSPRPVRGLKALLSPGHAVLWCETGTHIPRSLRFYFIEVETRHSGNATLEDVHGGRHVLTATTHNGQPIEGWGVVRRLYCAGSTTTTRAPVDSRYLVWGGGGRVRIKV